MTARKQKPTPKKGLRDEIAIRAMELLVGADPRSFLQQVCLPDPAPAISLANIARLSYGIADALLQERDRK